MLFIKETDSNSINTAVKILKSGGIISFATETVYALACDASNDLAIKKLYQLKRRQKEKPISVLVQNLSIAKKIFFLNEIEKKIAKKFMPGAITLIVKKKPENADLSISKLLNNNEEEIGFRIPDHDFSLKLLNKFNGIIAATSANISNQNPALNAKEVNDYFANKIDLLIDGGACKNKVASTVIKIEKNNAIKILRAGPVTIKDLEKFILINELN